MGERENRTAYCPHNLILIRFVGSNEIPRNSGYTANFNTATK